jgi:hypothetical protein
MTQEEAMAIAERAAANGPFEKLMSMTKIDLRAGRLTWVVCSATRGRVFVVTIDDESGAVLSAEVTGTR